MGRGGEGKICSVELLQQQPKKKTRGARARLSTMLSTYMRTLTYIAELSFINDRLTAASVHLFDSAASNYYAVCD